MCAQSFTNSHHTWNSQHARTQYQPGDLIYFNIVKRMPGRDSFRLSTEKMPNFLLNAQNFTDFDKRSLYEQNDIAEILRSDFSRLFFDIDVDNGVFTPQELNLTLEQIKTIISLLTIPPTNVYGVIEITTRKTVAQDLYLSWIQAFPNLMIISTPYNDKEFSAHLYVSGYYFNRTDLYNLFSLGLNHYNKDPELVCHLSSYIDHSIYVRAGAQKVFRFALSGKAMKNRPPPPFTDEQLHFVSNHILNYVCTKTEIDTHVITEASQEYQALKAYLDQFKGRHAARDTRRMKKQDMMDELEDDILHHERISKKYIAKQTTHALWWRSLILQIKNHLLSNPQATDEQLFDIFIREEYQYFSNSNNRRIRQPSDVRSAIREARKTEYISIEDIIDLSEQSKPDDEFMNKNNSLLYTLEQFKMKVQDIDGVSIPEFCKLLHFTFIFFTRSDSDKTSALSILYTETKEKKIVVKGYEEFLKMMKPSPINVRLIRQIEKVDGRKKDQTPQIVQIIQTISLASAFTLFDKYKQKFYDFRLCAKNTESLKYFSMYSNPTTAPKTPLPAQIDEILNIIATERSEEPNVDFCVNEEKKEYILNWFAYLLQHPESRNAVCLQVSTVQGIGKNILSNAVCDYLGSFFSEPSKDIDKVIGTYNGGIDNKLLIVMNEVDTSKKNTDLLKAVITEDTIQINVKYGMQYTGLNCANYLIYTNHEDTNTISNGDRRFTFIKSYGVPKPKAFYASICVPGKEGHLRTEIRNQFIKHLLSRDLSNYNPNEAKDFDKIRIQEKRQEARSAIYKCLVELLTSKEYPKDYILEDEFVFAVRTSLTGINQNYIYETYKVEKLKGIDQQIREEISNSCKTFTAKILNSVVNWDDEAILEKYKSKKRDSTRDKQIISLRTPKILKQPETVSEIPPEIPPEIPQNHEIPLDVLYDFENIEFNNYSCEGLDL